jgi:hypothetical protein
MILIPMANCYRGYNLVDCIPDEFNDVTENSDGSDGTSIPTRALIRVVSLRVEQSRNSECFSIPVQLQLTQVGNSALGIH